MSGLAGIIYPDPVQTGDLVRPMLETMSYRGGNIQYVFEHHQVQIGVCGQPLAINEDKTLAVGIDGEIVNLDKIVSDLEAAGRKVDPNNLAEVILNGFELWNMSLLEKIDGDFAIMIVDFHQGTVTLARDRIGKKPLYWYHDKHHFIWGSELKAMLATGIIPQTPAWDSISSYLYFGFIPQDMSAIKDVNKLLPSYYLQFTFHQGKVVQSYWSYSSHFEKANTAPKKAISSTLDHLLQDAVKERLDQEKKVGCLVSGGLGSATIAYYVKELANDKSVIAFSAGFKGQTDEDVKTAEEVCKDLAISQIVQEITPGNLLEDLVKIIWHLDEPLADPNITATWRLMKTASKFSDQIFSGMGSDELLAGHNRYTLAERNLGYVNRMQMLPKSVVQKILIPICKYIYKPSAYNILKVYRTNPWQFEYLRHNALFDEPVLAQVSPRLAKLFNADIFLHKFHHLSRITSNVASFQYVDVKTRLSDLYMVQYERLATVNNLKWKTPFLDRSIVEFSASLPEPQTLQESETASYLKPLIQNVFAEKVIKRPKRTRKAFLSSWSEHEDIRRAFEMLLQGTLVDTGIISKAWVQAQLNRIGEDPDVFHHLWAILVLEIWFKLYINSPIQSIAPDISVRKYLENN